MYRYRKDGTERSNQPLLSVSPRFRIDQRVWINLETVGRYFRMSGSNRVPLRPKRADKHSIGFNPVGRINLAPLRGGERGTVAAAAAEGNRFLPKLRRRARLRNRSGAHGSLNDTAPIFTRPDSRPTTARFDRSGFKFVGGSATSAADIAAASPAKIFPPSLCFLSHPSPLPLPRGGSRRKNSLNRENDRYDPIRRPPGNCVYSLVRACEIGDCFFLVSFRSSSSFSKREDTF